MLREPVFKNLLRNRVLVPLLGVLEHVAGLFQSAFKQSHILLESSQFDKNTKNCVRSKLTGSFFRHLIAGDEVVRLPKPFILVRQRLFKEGDDIDRLQLGVFATRGDVFSVCLGAVPDAPLYETLVHLPLHLHDECPPVNVAASDVDPR